MADAEEMRAELGEIGNKKGWKILVDEAKKHYGSSGHGS